MAQVTFSEETHEQLKKLHAVNDEIVKAYEDAVSAARAAYEETNAPILKENLEALELVLDTAKKRIEEINKNVAETCGVYQDLGEALHVYK